MLLAWWSHILRASTAKGISRTSRPWHRTPPELLPEACLPGTSFSKIMTDFPFRASSIAVAHPMIPPPAINTSAFIGSSYVRIGEFSQADRFDRWPQAVLSYLPWGEV